MDSVAKTLEQLSMGVDLAPEQADAVFDGLLSGTVTPAQAGAVLMGLRAKGETAGELACAVRAALRHALQVPGLEGPRIDTCGTGGDGKGTFNCSTAVAVYLADMGHKVVKHGNRAVSSSCGSADIVEMLGMPLNTAPEDVARRLKLCNFAFLFAQEYHPAFAAVAPVRRELGVRTLFNLMGPLLNPARPTHQLLGVGEPLALDMMADALVQTGVEHALVVHGAGGYDELTTFGPARCIRVRDGRCTAETIDPRALGLPAYAPEDVRVNGGREEALRTFRGLLRGEGPEAMKDMLALNLGAALHLLEDVPLVDAVLRARARVAQGIHGGKLSC